MSPQPFTDSHLIDLASVLSFTPADLAANRAGLLTKRQRRQLLHDHRRLHYPDVLAWSVGGALIGALALVNAEFTREWTLVCVGMLVLGGLSLYEIRQQIARSIADRRTAACVTLDTGAGWTPHRIRGSLVFEVGELRFRAPDELADVLRAGMRYCVYYAPGTRRARFRVLSIAPEGESAPS